jgi:hypothetical protein
VGEEYHYISHENWLLYTKDSEVADAVKACVAGTSQNVEGSADEPARRIVMESDAAVWINIAQLVETFSDEIDRASIEARLALAEAGNSVPSVEGINLAAALEMYADLLDGLLQGLKDSRSCTIGLTVEAAGLGFHEYVHLKDDSATDRALRKHRPSALTTFANLPENQLGYLGLHGDMNAFMDWGMNLMMDMLDSSDEDRKAMADVLEESKQLEYGDYVAAFRIGSFDSGLMNMTVLSQVNNAARLRGVYEKIFKAMQNLGSNELLSQSIEFEGEAETIDGYKVDKMTVVQEFDETLDPTGLQRQMMQIMYGPEGAVTRIAYTENHVAQTTGGGKEQMEALLKSLKTPAAAEAFDRARQQLLPQANVVVMFDLAGIVGSALQAVIDSGTLPLPITEDQIDDLGLKPSFMGFSVSTGKSSIQAKHFIESEQIRGLYQIGVLGFGLYQSLSAPQF